MEGGLGEHHAGELRREAAEAKAERLVVVAEELRRLGRSEEELKHRRKNDAGKLASAVRLRRETTLKHQSHSRANGAGKLQHRKRSLAPRLVGAAGDYDCKWPSLEIEMTQNTKIYE